MRLFNNNFQFRIFVIPPSILPSNHSIDDWWAHPFNELKIIVDLNQQWWEYFYFIENYSFSIEISKNNSTQLIGFPGMKNIIIASSQNRIRWKKKKDWIGKLSNWNQFSSYFCCFNSTRHRNQKKRSFSGQSFISINHYSDIFLISELSGVGGNLFSCYLSRGINWKYPVSIKILARSE